MKRRNFITQSMFASALPLMPGRVLSFPTMANQNNEGLVRFGMIADIHKDLMK